MSHELLNALNDVLAEKTLTPWPARKARDPRLDKLRDFRKGEHVTAPKDSGNGKLELSGRCDDHIGQSYGKSSRVGQRERQSWWQQEPEGDAGLSWRIVRILRRKGFVASYKRDAIYSTTGTYMWIYEGDVVCIEASARRYWQTVQRVTCPALAAAIREFTSYEDGLLDLDEVERRIAVEDADYEERWLAHLEATRPDDDPWMDEDGQSEGWHGEDYEAEARGNTLRVVYNNDGTYDIDDTFSGYIVF